jgi:nucleotide-binding universal stress UspA family protein
LTFINAARLPPADDKNHFGERAMFKDVVVNLSIGGGKDPAADYAISVAEAFDAHIAGIAFAYEPVIPPTVMGSLSSDFIDAQRAESEKAAQAVIARFEAAAKRSSLSAETRMLSGTLAAATEMFGRVARRFDLAVVCQPEPNVAAPEELLMEGALFDSGRPVLVVPYIQKAGLKLDRVICCWDGSRTAARAIADAMPLLKKATAVDLLIVATARVRTDEITGADMGKHLARHGLAVDVKRLASPDVDVADAILSYAADSAADFIVMGGYGHSRLREFILGGTTRGILKTMTVPTLMSH